MASSPDSGAPRWLPIVVAVIGAFGAIAGAFILSGAFNSDNGPSAPGPADTSTRSKPQSSRLKDLRVLLAIDTSGSMNTPVSPRARRITSATNGALAALDQLTSPWELGLWTFRQMGHHEELPIAPDTQDGQVPELRRQLRLLPGRQRDDGGTPLYNTISDGIQVLKDYAQSDSRATISALVVLTDSRDNPPKRLVREGDAVSAGEIDSLLTSVKDKILVVVTAAFAETQCSELWKDVPALRGHCVDVRGPPGVKPTLTKIVGSLQDARQR